MEEKILFKPTDLIINGVQITQISLDESHLIIRYTSDKEINNDDEKNLIEEINSKYNLSKSELLIKLIKEK